MGNLVYREDIVNEFRRCFEELRNAGLFADHESLEKVMGAIINRVNTAPSSYWHPCTDEDNVPPKGEEVLVTLEYPNGRKEVAFGENWGHDINGDIAFWGGQNELVRAWGEVPSAYECEDK